MESKIKPKTVGIYEAKTQLSKLVRAVRSHGVSFQLSDRGQPVAMLVPIVDAQSLDQHMQSIRQAGNMSIPDEPLTPWKPVTDAPGALARFLRDRHERE